MAHPHRLLRLIALGLQLEPTFFDSSFDAATSNVRVIHYLPGEHCAKDGIFGVGERISFSCPGCQRLCSPWTAQDGSKG